MQRDEAKTTKSIRVDIETYRILCRERRGRRDSFSQVIRRLYSANTLAGCNRDDGLAQLTRHTGTFKDFMTQEDLGRIRVSDERLHARRLKAFTALAGSCPDFPEIPANQAPNPIREWE